jgi:hypothetical protein
MITGKIMMEPAGIKQLIRIMALLLTIMYHLRYLF